MLRKLFISIAALALSLTLTSDSLHGRENQSQQIESPAPSHFFQWLGTLLPESSDPDTQTSQADGDGDQGSGTDPDG